MATMIIIIVELSSLFPSLSSDPSGFDEDGEGDGDGDGDGDELELVEGDGDGDELELVEGDGDGDGDGDVFDVHVTSLPLPSSPPPVSEPPSSLVELSIPPPLFSQGKVPAQQLPTTPLT